MSTQYVTFSIRRDTLDRLRATLPPGITYSDYLDQLMDQEVEASPDGAWRRLALEFTEKAQRLEG